MPKTASTDLGKLSGTHKNCKITRFVDSLRGSAWVSRLYGIILLKCMKHVRIRTHFAFVPTFAMSGGVSVRQPLLRGPPQSGMMSIVSRISSVKNAAGVVASFLSMAKPLRKAALGLAAIIALLAPQKAGAIQMIDGYNYKFGFGNDTIMASSEKNSCDNFNYLKLIIVNGVEYQANNNGDTIKTRANGTDTSGYCFYIGSIS